MIVLLSRAYFARQTPPATIAIDRVLAAVSNAMRTTPDELASHDRRREISYARHLAMYLAHHDGRAQIAAIKRRFGDRDHSTVIGGIKRIELELRTRPETAADVAAVRALLTQPEGVAV